MMNNLDHNQIVQYIVTLLDPRSTRDQRIYSQNYLEELKKNKESFSTLGIIILAQELDESIRLLALSIFHDWIRKWWNSFPLDIHLQIREIFSSLLMQASLKEYDGNFCSKISSILAEIAERSFPQHWTTMMNDFIGIWIQNQYSAPEIILKTLAFLYIDCTDSEFTNQLTSTRRQEILSGLKLFQEDLLKQCYHYFHGNLEICLKNPLLNTSIIPNNSSSSSSSFSMSSLTTSSSSTSTTNINQKAIILTLNLLEAMTSVVEANDYLLLNHNFLFLLLQSLTLPIIQLECLNLIQMIFKKKFHKENVQLILTLLSSEKQISFPTDRSDFLLFIRNYSIIITKFISLNIEEILELINEKPSTNLISIQKILLEFNSCLETDSRKLIGEVIVDFTKVRKCRFVDHPLPDFFVGLSL
jgi:hypothetical protein